MTQGCLPAKMHRLFRLAPVHQILFYLAMKVFLMRLELFLELEIDCFIELLHIIAYFSERCMYDARN